MITEVSAMYLNISLNMSIFKILIAEILTKPVKTESLGAEG